MYRVGRNRDRELPLLRICICPSAGSDAWPSGRLFSWIGKEIRGRKGHRMEGNNSIEADGTTLADRRIAELEAQVRQLQRIETQFRMLLEAAPDAVVIVDEAGRIVLVNEQTEKTFGYSRAELLGSPVEILVPERFRQSHLMHRDTYAQCPHTRPMGANVELCGRRRDGSEFPAEISLSPRRTEDGSLVFCAVRDVTQRKTAEKALHDHEVQMAAAQQIQEHLLPQRPPMIPGFDVIGASHPAEFAAGDHFDYFRMPDNSLAVVIGDVTGHGFGPALIMASVHTLIRSFSQRSSDVTEILHHANHFLCEETDDQFFATVFFARLDTETRRFEYASAGHPPAYVFDRSGEIRTRLESTGIPLGIYADATTPMGQGLTLEEGDVVLMLTDGAVETQSPSGDLFGVGRAIQCVRQCCNRPAQEIIDCLYRAVLDFSGQADPEDDITAVVLKVCSRDAS